MPQSNAVFNTLPIKEQIQRWYFEGKSIAQTADLASRKYNKNVTTRQILAVIHRTRDLLYRRDFDNLSARRADEIGKIDRLEQEAWEAWFRSIDRSNATSTTKITTSDLKEIDDYDSRDNDADHNTTDNNNQYDDMEIPDTDSPDDHAPHVWDTWAQLNREEFHQSKYRGGNQFRSSGSSGKGNNRYKKNGHLLDGSYPAQNNTDDPNAPKPPVFNFTKRIIQTAGDPRFIQMIQWCIDKRCKLLGLDAPAKSITATATVEQMRQMAREMAIEKGMDPDLVLDDVMADVNAILANSRQ